MLRLVVLVGCAASVVSMTEETDGSCPAEGCKDVADAEKRNGKVPLRSLGIPLGHVEVRDTIPTAAEVANHYMNPVGTPVLLKGAAHHILTRTKVEDWTDDFLAKKYPKLKVEAESERIETREAEAKQMKLKGFLKKYRIKEKPLYSVTPIHDSPIGSEFKLPPFIGCGKWLDRLQSVVFWLGDYETKSVLHNDDVDGIMCLLSGQKRWYFIDKRHFKKVQSKACGWNVADKTGRGYGEFVRMNVDNVRPQLHECYDSMEWYHADMEAGDCLLTPTGWFHQVSSFGRALGILMWAYAVPDFNKTSATACAEDDPVTTPLNKLRWHGDEDVTFTARDERWALKWFKQNAPDHPYPEFLTDGRKPPPIHADDEEEEDGGAENEDYDE